MTTERRVIVLVTAMVTAGMIGLCSLAYTHVLPKLMLLVPPEQATILPIAFPPKDQARLALPQIVRRDIGHRFQTRKVDL